VVIDMNNNSDAILEECLSQIITGRASLQSCLVSYPALADELRPLLLAAEQLWVAPKPFLTPEAKARIEARLLAEPHGESRSALLQI
jgi:hypothetical protein